MKFAGILTKTTSENVKMKPQELSNISGKINTKIVTLLPLFFKHKNLITLHKSCRTQFILEKCNISFGFLHLNAKVIGRDMIYFRILFFFFTLMLL